MLCFGRCRRGKGTRISFRVRTFIMITFICKVATDKLCTGDTFFPVCLASLLRTSDGESDLRARGKGKHWVNLQGVAAADVL